MKSYFGHIVATTSILLMAFTTVGLFVALWWTVSNLIDLLANRLWLHSGFAAIELLIAGYLNYFWYSSGRGMWMRANTKLQKKLFGEVF